MLDATVSLPTWVRDAVDFEARYESDDEKMRLAIRLADENVLRKTGGPFGAAVFERGTGQLISVGVNSVVRLNNCTLHAEMVAYQLAQKRIQSYSLGTEGHPAHELFTSCEPCAMCLGATLWSGVQRVVIAASRDDAIAIGFDEGPVFAESYGYLRDRGVDVRHGVLRDEGRAVLQRYQDLGGPVYNG
ncbi:MAG: nucleoside deaminase [Gemmatimonas sp.]|nr:nucleoside deaminase [Gemmatimonas sp.]